MNKKLLIIPLVLVLAGALFFAFKGKTAGSGVKEIRVHLNDYSSSGQSGDAVLTEHDGKITVTLEMGGTKYGKPQPSHIHSGTCPRIGPIIYDLEDVVNDASTTELDTTLDKLLAKGEQININVHHSYDDFQTYTACGDLKK